MRSEQIRHLVLLPQVPPSVSQGLGPQFESSRPQLQVPRSPLLPLIRRSFVHPLGGLLNTR